METEQQVLLLFAVMYFYFTIFAQIAFLLLSRCYVFNTLRERTGYGKNIKLKNDYLTIVKDDVHWMLLVLTNYGLFLFIVYQYGITGEIKSSTTKIVITTVVSVRFLSNLYLNHMFFFSKTNLFKNGVFN